MDEGTKKELVVGATGAGAAAAAAGAAAGPLAAASLAGVVTLVTLAYSLFMGRDQRRSERLFERMAEADDEPDAFVALLAEKLRDGDEEVLIKLRALIRADLEAASPDALPAIALIGREYVRGTCPAWVARGWVRLLSELDSSEVCALRELAIATQRSIVAGDVIMERHQHQVREDSPPMAVAILLSKRTLSNPGYDEGLPPSLWVWPASQEKGKGIPGVYTPSAPRLFDLLVHHGVASARATLVEDWPTRKIQPDDRPAVQMSRESASALVLAFRA